jgi:hypothetical protein
MFLTQPRLVSPLSQSPHNSVNTIVSESVSCIFPEGVSPETYNSQYLQKNSSSPIAIFAAAKVAAQVFNDPQEVENISFSALAESVQLDIAVRDHYRSSFCL